MSWSGRTRSMPSLIARFMGPTWGPVGAGSTQVGPMLAPWTLLSVMVADVWTLRRQTISGHFIDCNTSTSLSLWGRISTTCVLPVWRDYTLPAKNMEYVESAMETLVFDILVCWKWLGANTKQVLWLYATLPRSVMDEMQLAMSKLKDTL